MRWNTRLRVVRKEHERRDQLLTALKDAAAHLDEARIALTLCKLDLALAGADRDAAAALVEHLKVSDPGPLSHLLKAARGEDHPAYVARFYPY